MVHIFMFDCFNSVLNLNEALQNELQNRNSDAWPHLSRSLSAAPNVSPGMDPTPLC